MLMHGFCMNAMVATLRILKIGSVICYDVKIYIIIGMLFFPSPLPSLYNHSHCHIHPSTPPRRPIYPVLSFFIVAFNYCLFSSSNQPIAISQSKLFSCNLKFNFASSASFQGWKIFNCFLLSMTALH